MGTNLFKVLVADDEYWIRENLRGVINWREYGFDFLEPAEDGEDALQKAREHLPDIVITDINMPFLSGTELMKRLREEFPNMAVLVLSGYNDFAYVREALVVGALDYLLKPIQKEELLKVLEKAVERITALRSQQQEQRALRERLKIASSMLKDRQMSMLLHRTSDQRTRGEIQAQLAEYELTFSGFTLALFKTAGIAKIAKKRQGEESDKIIYEIKGKISRQVENSQSLVFNYIYRTNEFLLITDMEGQRLIGVCKKLIGELERRTGFGVTAAVSQHYFTFSSLNDAYREALLAQMACVYGGSGSLVRIGEVKACPVAKKVTLEQEKQLAFAAQSKNGALFRQVAYHQVGLMDSIRKNWSIVEMRQTVDSVIWTLRSNLPKESLAAQSLALENLAELALQAIDNSDHEEFLSSFEQLLEEFFGAGIAAGQSDSMRHTIGQIQAYIEQNYFEDLSLTELSKRFLVESSYLSKAFKQVTGSNLMLYIATLRMSKAKEYMCQGNLSITEISQLVGYDDYGYFNRVFRKIEGQSPREYKESLSAQQKG